MKGHDELHSFLAIDKNDLDRCLMEQPEIYFKVADATVIAESERDAVKLELEELQATLGEDIRNKSSKEEKRLTDKAVEQRVLTLPKVSDLQRVLLKKQREAKHWKALERSFDQRASMLKELVSLHVRQGYGYALEAGSGQARTAIADRNRQAAGELRRQRRGS